jgi:hypothetical protein
MKEYKLPINTFMGGWYINEKICDDMIKYFKKSKEKYQGTYEKNNEIKINKDIKDSIDVSVRRDNFEYPFLDYQKELQKCLNNYILKYSEVNLMGKFNLSGNYAIQFYKKNGGYKKFHFERCYKSDPQIVLVFMTYLNDVENGGTEFKYQKLITPAKKGLTLIWPTDWTHTHRSQVSSIESKYIVTGWFAFE